MNDDMNPQSAQMAHESMVRTLLAQVRCIWPQEEALFTRYGAPGRILDVGCGSGEFAARLAEKYPFAQIEGVDIDADHVRRARERCAPHGDRLRFGVGDAYGLDVSPADLVVCRHVLQALPNPEQVVDQCFQAARPGGWVHLLLEDYAMIHIEGPAEFDYFWLNGPVRYGERTMVTHASAGAGLR